jgi:hypothetical protein
MAAAQRDTSLEMFSESKTREAPEEGDEVRTAEGIAVICSRVGAGRQVLLGKRH